MALVISPGSVEKDGGYKITLTGLSLVDGDYFFHVGPLGTHQDPKAYAGSGKGNTVTVTGTSGSFVAPAITTSGSYQVSAYSTASPSVSGTVLASGIGYYNSNYRSSVYSYRSLQPGWWKPGPGATTEEDAQ